MGDEVYKSSLRQFRCICGARAVDITDKTRYHRCICCSLLYDIKLAEFVPSLTDDDLN